MHWLLSAAAMSAGCGLSADVNAAAVSAGAAATAGAADSAGGSHSAAAAPEAVRAQAREIFAHIIGIESSIGKGNVPVVAKYLADRFKAGGFPAEIGRASCRERVW